MSPSFSHFEGPFPSNEAARLRALRKCRVFSRQDDDLFECIVAMAQTYFGINYAFMTVIEQHEQHIKAPSALNLPPGDRGLSFCTHTILGQDILVVNDTLEHPLFKDNPAVTSWPFIRFYAGAPILVQRQYAIGAICVVDDEPRDFTEREHDMLRQLAEMAAIMLERRMPFLEYMP